MSTAKIFFSLLLLGIGYVLVKIKQSKQRSPLLRSVVILVLGDIGRSPRMMYHAESFANHGFKTTLVGYEGSKAIPSLLSIPLIKFLYLPQPPSFASNLPFILGAPVKIVHQIVSIMDALLYQIVNPPEFIIVQNPPGIPTLALVWVFSHLRSTKVIIDWHNLGYTILGLRLGQDHVVVKIAKWFEQYFGQSAYAHLFVTKAMKERLTQDWGLRGHKVVLHDRPPSGFHRCSPYETHMLFCTLESSLTPLTALDGFLPAWNTPHATPFTQTTENSAFSSPRKSSYGLPGSITTAMQTIQMPTLRPERTALLLSSTSWTADEDFGMLIDALAIYERMATKENSSSGGRSGLPKVLMVVTGKGPLKEVYMNRIEGLQKEWNWVRCVSLWLDAADYPLLLGSADLGICLHSSSSALDLPMKIVDMFGCGLPVCALDFACLNELVKPGLNGLVFKTAEELAGQLVSLLKSFPHSASLDSLRFSLIKSASSPSASSAYSFSSSLRQQNTNSDEEESSETSEPIGVPEKWEWNTWAENWNEVVKPLVLHDASGSYHQEWK